MWPQNSWGPMCCNFSDKKRKWYFFFEMYMAKYSKFDPRNKKQGRHKAQSQNRDLKLKEKGIAAEVRKPKRT